MDRYDVVIIGGGLGGLECGVVLSREGFKVCVLEKNTRPGGCFQSFFREGRLLDTGIHYVGSMDEGKILHQYFKYFGILEQLQLQRLDEDAFDVVCFGGQEYPYAMGPEHFVERLSEYFPGERENLLGYVRQLQAVGRLIGVDGLRQGKLSAGGLEYFAQSAWEQIQSATPNGVLQQVLAGTNMLYGGLQDKSTFYHHAMINNSNLDGAYRFVGGSMQVTDALTKVIRRHGGEVLCGSKATRLIVNENKISAVEINGLRQIECRQVISSLHPCRTLELLDPNRYIKKAYFSRMKSLENSYGVFTVYLMLKKNKFPYLNRNYYLYKEDDVWYDPRNSRLFGACLLSMSPDTENGHYADVVSLMVPMYFQEVEQWNTTDIGNRGESYEEFKYAKSQELVRLASHWFPQLPGNIEKIFSTTPLSFRDFTGTEEGSAYGVVKNCNSPLTTLISPRTKIGNLLLTGQSLNVHGALGVTLTAMLTCAELLGCEYLAKKIGAWKY